MATLHRPVNPYSERWHNVPDGAIPLTVADMDFPTDPRILTALGERLTRPLAYPPPYTTGGLGDLLADHYRLRYGADVNRDCFWLTGSTLATANLIFREFLNPGDEALYLAPSYPPIPQAITQAAATAIPIVLHGDRPLTRADMESRITARTRAIHLCNPHNPTGRILSRTELQAVADTAREHDLRIVSDEIHSRLVLDPHHQHIPIATLDADTARRTLTLDGPTKSHNLAGLGGAILWSPDADAVHEIRHRIGARATPARSLQQAAIGDAYTDDSPWLTDTIRTLRTHRDLLIDALNAHPHRVTYRPGPASYFAWIDFHDTFAGRDAAQALAEHGLLLMPGHAYGADPCWARLSFATTTELLTEAITRLHSVLTSPDRSHV